MRLYNKFHTVCALAVASILLSAWFLASQNYYRRVVPTNGEDSSFNVATSFDRRLVVFGDSWSDNNAGELQGSVWTEWLCSKVGKPKNKGRLRTQMDHELIHVLVSMPS